MDFLLFVCSKLRPKQFIFLCRGWRWSEIQKTESPCGRDDLYSRKKWYKQAHKVQLIHWELKNLMQYFIFPSSFKWMYVIFSYLLYLCDLQWAWEWSGDASSRCCAKEVHCKSFWSWQSQQSVGDYKPSSFRPKE